MKKEKNSFKSFILAIVIVLSLYVYDTYLKEPINNILNGTNDTESVSQTRQVDGDLSVYFIDVGQADSIMITNNNHYMLIDAGNNEDGSKLVTYFKNMGIESFDYVIGTHAHEDHIGGMDDIINNFNINTFYMPDVVTTTKTFEDVVTSLENKSLAFSTPKIDSTFNFSDAVFDVLYVGDEESDLNDSSIVLKMTYGDNSFLFTGDATSKVEKQILNKKLQADVLKVGHHGSSYSTTQDFLDKVNPKYAVIEVGKGNTYDHPKDVTLQKLKEKNIKLYRTDYDGTIIMTSNGKSITVKTLETDTNG